MGRELSSGGRDRRRRMTEPRVCGACQACCHTLKILDPPSPAGVDCIHQCAAGCSVYSTRPADCEGWSCDWLDGQGEDEPWGTDAQRPDKVGLVFSEAHRGSARAREVWPGASREAPGLAAIAQLLQRVRLVLVYCHGNNTELCDDWRPRDGRT